VRDDQSRIGTHGLAEAHAEIGMEDRMKKHDVRRWIWTRSTLGLALLSALILTGCPNPYALKVSKVNYEAPQTKAVIQFTDPKLYKREALINERRDELAYLKKELDESRAKTFEPSIVREIELVQAFSAELGLKFDPVAAAQFKRQEELSGLRQEIDVTRLEMQLAQLQRDAELFKEKLKSQTEPSADAGKADDVKPSSDKIEVQPEDTGKLLTAIDALRKSLHERFAAKDTAPRSAAGVASPIDIFNDRQALRATIKSAINTTALDELHDYNGNSLFRVQLQATLFPGQSNYADTLGVLRMDLKPPVLDEDAIRKLYLRWLGYVNSELNIPPGKEREDASGATPADQTHHNAGLRLGQNPRILALAETRDLFQVVTFRMKKDLNGKAACSGTGPESDTRNCWYVRVALPPDVPANPVAADSLDWLTQDSKRLTDMMREATRAIRAEKNDAQRFALQTRVCDAFLRQSSEPLVTMRRFDDKGKEIAPHTYTPDQVLSWARIVQSSWPYLANALGFVADADFGDRDVTKSIAIQFGQIVQSSQALMRATNAFLKELAERNATCKARLLAPPTETVPGIFREAVVDDKHKSVTRGRVAVYEVSPKDRAQQVSTAARAADAVALAAAVAGQIPQTGLGFSGNASFARSAVGKADALERVPLVVGFAEPGLNTTDPSYPRFGWVMGPSVVLDAEHQALVLEHRVAPYELYADLSVPGWWPWFELTAYTAWAPDWRKPAVNGNTLNANDEFVVARPVKVTMRPNRADMAGLTTLVIEQSSGTRIERPTITRVRPEKFSICEEITLSIEGDGVWRAAEAYIEGLRIASEEDIRVLPDMQGVSVKIAAGKIPEFIDSNTPHVTIWTHNGSASYPIALVGTKSADGKCTRANPPKEAEDGKSGKKPSLARVLPEKISMCDPEAVLFVEGKNLSNIAKVSLGTIPARSSVIGSDGTLLKVTVNTRRDGIGRIGNQDKLPLVVQTGAGFDGKDVGVDTSVCLLRESAPMPDTTGGPVIERVLPRAMSVCDPEPKFLVLGKGLTNVKSARLGTLTASYQEIAGSSGTTLEVSASQGPFKSQLAQIDELALLVRTGAGVAEFPISVKQGSCPDPR
jgi:hypothetical protein